MPKMIYLACPYNHPDPVKRKYRFSIANQIAAKLIDEGYHVYSPISHTHPISEYSTTIVDWLSLDFAFLKICDELHIITMEGWEISKGVRQEIEWAKHLNLPIHYIERL